MSGATRQRLLTALKASLAEASPENRLLSVSVEVSGLDLVDWLCAQTNYPRIYWRSRDDAREYAGIGRVNPFGGETAGAGEWAAISSLLDEMPDVIAFFGMRFDTGRVTGDEWHAFAAQTFVIPEFMLQKDGTGIALRANVVPGEAMSHEQILAAFADSLERIVMEPAPADLRAGGHTVHRELPARDVWLEQVRTVARHVGADGMRKAVLARRLDLVLDAPPDPFIFMKHFSAMRSPAYFFCWQPESGCAFLGSSPEQFVTRNGDCVASEALAGTRPRGATDREDQALKEALRQDTKDLHEHALVHEHILRTFGQLCVEVKAEEAPEVLQLILVQHLLQRTTGRLRSDVTDETLVKMLHPTPAVGGVPTDRALAMIASLEPFDRGWYAAPLGIISRDRLDLTVAIRSGLLHGNTLSLYCGAGIVPESDPAAEWRETEVKFSNFLNVIHAD